MNRHDYLDQMQEAITEWLYDNRQIIDECTDIDELRDKLNDNLWDEDSITGNASGFYFSNSWKAEEAIAHSWDLVAEALQEFGYSNINPFDKGAKWCDVLIRCYLLSEAINQTLDAIVSIEESKDGDEIIILADIA